MSRAARVIKDQFLSVVRWFDSGAGRRSLNRSLAQAPQTKRVDWSRMLPFFGLHLMCAFVLVTGVSWFAVAVAVLLYVVRMFAITGFYHRYFSHRTFKTSRACQFVFALLGNSAVQRGPLWWAAHHRHHHKTSDQAEDVHSPHQHGFFWSHMGWLTSRANFSTDLKAVHDLARYPELRFLDRFDTLVPVALATLLLVLGEVLAAWAPGLHTNGFQLLVWGFFVSTVALFHGTCTINSLAHLIGRPRYATKDKSKNSLLLALITLGEGWHNNHHRFPGAVRQGFRWWEIDVTFYLLKMMSWLRLIWDLRPVPRAAF